MRQSGDSGLGANVNYLWQVLSALRSLPINTQDGHPGMPRCSVWAPGTENGASEHPNRRGDHGESSASPQAGAVREARGKIKLHVYSLLKETKEYSHRLYFLLWYGRIV